MRSILGTKRMQQERLQIAMYAGGDRRILATNVDNAMNGLADTEDVMSTGYACYVPRGIHAHLLARDVHGGQRIRHWHNRKHHDRDQDHLLEHQDHPFEKSRFRNHLNQNMHKKNHLFRTYDALAHHGGRTILNALTTLSHRNHLQTSCQTQGSPEETRPPTTSGLFQLFCRT